jgi:cellulose synthase/poly-beta-1,6-N-acetylglucosamine synthase-like glycosyltransferase
MEYEAMDAVNAGMSAGSIVFSLVVFVLSIVAYWRIFEKAGEAGWKSIIPIYDVYILFKIAWGKGWMFLLLFIPVVNIVIYILMLYKLNKAFDKGVGFFILLLLLPNIGYLILAFDGSEYIGPQ